MPYDHEKLILWAIPIERIKFQNALFLTRNCKYIEIDDGSLVENGEQHEDNMDDDDDE